MMIRESCNLIEEGQNYNFWSRLFQEKQKMVNIELQVLSFHVASS